jgi:CheY-like chemotaxis protein
MRRANYHAEGGVMRSRRVLVVDPHADGRQALCTLLQSLGHDVAATGDFDVALELVETHRPELLICETALGGATSGYDLARRLQGRGIYLLAYSGRDQLEQRTLAEDAGFHHFLSKPSTVREFRLLFEGWDAAEGNVPQ